ncbi:MAG: AmmeMemoRadiSam system radical SAM enzyme [Eggerthellaceae bacterium]|nr:AmmeMemoRadiSam system radical SAM enzyme [Eggerthellaceae bacterium]
MATCATCPHACDLKPGQLGLCRSRRASDGGSRVLPEGYGRVTSLALDPIEKKPISCWRAGTSVLSLGSYGCNMRCPFCQNASIATAAADDIAWREVTPEEIVSTALDLRGRDCIGIAYTYNEPLVNWEFLRDTGTLAHEAGLVNVLVSNGMATEAVLSEVAPLVDAANIDLKCFTDEGYRKLGGDLHAVKRTIEALAASPACHLEVTTLVVPGLSDDEAQVDAMARYLSELDPRIVYHLTRFFPRHRMSAADPTPVRTLHRLREVASNHLATVLIGNV